jgi:hypothetical protein
LLGRRVIAIGDDRHHVRRRHAMSNGAADTIAAACNERDLI